MLPEAFLFESCFFIAFFKGLISLCGFVGAQSSFLPLSETESGISFLSCLFRFWKESGITGGDFAVLVVHLTQWRSLSRQARFSAFWYLTASIGSLTAVMACFLMVLSDASEQVSKRRRATSKGVERVVFGV